MRAPVGKMLVRLAFLAAAAAVAWGLAAPRAAAANAGSPSRAAAEAAHAPEGTPRASPLPSIPPGGRPPGIREPAVGVAGAVALVVAAGAGLWIYRAIRKGL